MIAYCIGVLPFIRELRNSHPRFTQPWYADDSGAIGTFQQILENFRDLQARGPARGYYLELTKIILVVALGNVARAEEHFWGIGIRVVAGHQYMGGYIGDGEAERSWLKDKIQGWTESMKFFPGWPKSTCSLITKECKIPSSRSGL